MTCVADKNVKRLFSDMHTYVVANLRQHSDNDFNIKKTTLYNVSDDDRYFNVLGFVFNWTVLILLESISINSLPK